MCSLRINYNISETTPHFTGTNNSKCEQFDTLSKYH